MKGTDITPVTGADLYFGFGGLAVDAQKPGTVMVAALNSWWPDGQIYRSTDRCGRAHSVRSYTYPTSSGSTWSPFWDWASYPTINKYYSYSDDLAPWLGVDYVDQTLGNKQIGWMMEGALSLAHCALRCV